MNPRPVKAIIEQIDKLFSSTSISQARTKADLEYIIEHCTILIGTLDKDKEDE